MSKQQPPSYDPLDLKLDGDEDYPRRLVVFPGGQILACGGDDGVLTVIEQQGNNKVRVARHFDDGAVRAVAVSDDGKRVAVGFDNGSTRIYQYNDYNVTTNHEESHPFFPKKKSSNEDHDDNSDNDDEDAGLGIFSQPADDDEEDDECRCWAGPQFDSPVRDLKFMPVDNSNGDMYMLAMACESGLCLVNVATAQSMDKRYLQHQVEKEHDEGGIRGVCFAQSNSMILMASLAMDGRMCLWNVTQLATGSFDANENVPVYRDVHKCVTIQDIGEISGASPADRSCWPLLWTSNNSTTYLALPGTPALQLRRVSLEENNGTTIQVESSSNDKENLPEGPVLGHVEPVVLMAVHPKTKEHMVTTGQDGRVVLWLLETDEDDLPTAKFTKQLTRCESIPTSMHWDADRHLLFVACANGTMITIDKMDQHVKVPKETRSSTSKKTTNKAQPQSTKTVPKESATKSTTTKTAASLEDSDDDAVVNKVKATVSAKKADKEEKDDGNLFGTATDDEDDMYDDKKKKEDDNARSTQTQKKIPTLRETLAAMESDDDDEIPSSTTPPAPANQKSRATSPKEKSKTKRRLVRKAAADASDDDEEDVFADVQEKATTKAPSLKSVLADMDDDDDDDIPATSPPAQTNISTDDVEEADVKPTEQSELASGANENNPPSPTQKSNRVSIGSPGDLDMAADEKLDGPSPKKNDFIDDEADDAADDDDDEVMEKEPSSKENITADKDNQASHGGDDFHHDDDDGFGDHGDDDDGLDDVEEITNRFNARHAAGRGMMEPLPEPQAAFAPSSTPLDLPRRFLCWNHIGSVTLLQEDDGPTRSTVDIHFTDSAWKRPVSFTDNMGFILGSLGDDGGIFATALPEDDEDDDNDLGDIVEGLHMSEKTKQALKRSQKKRMKKGNSAGGSSIYFHRYETFASVREKDWTLTLPDGELVLGTAAGQGWAAVATNRKFLRLFTSGGNQAGILWLPGPPVTVVGRNRFLAVFYHEGEPLRDGTQKLGYMLYDAASNTVLSKSSASCISSGSHLSWAGFSDDCSLMTMDTDGMLSMLIMTSSMPDDENDVPKSWEWAPLLDTVGLRKSSDDNFWPVTVYSGKLVCVPLKGGTEHPDATRRPVTTTLSLKMPLARGTQLKGTSHALEELSVRSNMALAQKRTVNLLGGGEVVGDEFEDELRKLTAQVDKVTLKLFAAIVNANKLERALDLVDRLQLEQSYNIATKIAASHHKLCDLIEEARDSRFAADEDDDGYDDDDNGHDYTDDYDDGDGRLGTSPPHRESRPHKRISPDTNQALSRPNPKRSFADHFSKSVSLHQERNVKSRR